MEQKLLFELLRDAVSPFKSVKQDFRKLVLKK